MCPACVRHWASLLVQHRLQNSSENVQSSSSVNYRYLSMSQLVTQLQSIHHDNHLLSKQCKRLTQKLEEDYRRRGVDVDDATHDGLMEIMKQQGNILLPPNSFQELFWKQQKEAATKNDSRGMHWYPLMIRGGAYTSRNCLAFNKRSLRVCTYTYIGIVSLPAVTLESCLRSIDIYIQRSAMERISPGAT